MTNTQTAPVDTTPVVELTKSAKSDVIYAEEFAKGEDGLRARVLDRFEKELGLKKQGGGSTYFQNAKKRASGDKVKNYYTPKSKAPKADDNVDDSKEDAPLFDVELKDGTTKSFLSQQDADDFKTINADLIG